MSAALLQRAAKQATDVGIRTLLGDLAFAEGTEGLAARLSDKLLTPNVRKEEDETQGACSFCNMCSPAWRG